jgi:tryptophan synthase alpha chain
MTSVAHCFQALRSQEACALIPFITAGDPDLATTAQALRVLDQAGADLIELGVPYSDPLADGPVIQAAATRALGRGVRLEDVLAIVRSLKGEIKAPIILFTYYNPIFYRGIDLFLREIADAGVKGLVVPDLPLEEADSLLKPAAQMGIDVTLRLVRWNGFKRSPNSPRDLSIWSVLLG